MMTQEVTDSKILNQIIEQHNPFAAKVTAQHSVWNRDYSGVPEINQNALDKILELIDAVDTGKSVSEGALIVGERGLGKTQLLARLHHHLNMNDKAFFVYMGEYDNLDAIKSEFLQALVYSLKREYRPGVTQWQALAAEMYFEARGNTPCSVDHLIQQFPKILASKPQLVNTWTNGIAAKCPEVKNVFLIRAILWTLLPEAAPFAAMWLAGKELATESSERLGLPIRKESDSLAYTCDLLNLIVRYKPIVFCFDELDTPEVSSQMLTVSQVVLGLAKYLRDNIKRFVALLAIFPQTLQEDIISAQSSGSTQIRAGYDRFDHEILLELLDEKSSLALIKHRLKHFYEYHNVIPSDPFYPFQEDKLRQAFASEKSPARQVLRWCEDNWLPIIGNVDKPIEPEIEKPPIPIEPPESIKVFECYKEQLKEIDDRIDEIVDDSDKVSKALRFAFNHLVGKVVDELKVFEVLNEPDRIYSDFVPFKVKVRRAENQKGPFTFIGIAVIQKTGVSLTNALSKLVKFNTLNQTRACIIRSEDINGEQARKHALTILQNGGECIVLRAEHIAPIMALQSLTEKLEQYDLTQEEIMEFVERENLLINNPLIQEILSKPDGKIPKDFRLSDINTLASIPKALMVSNVIDAGDLQEAEPLLTEEL